MSARFGSQSMVAPLRRVLVKKPGAAFGSADPRRWHYSGRPDLEIARREHDAFVEVLLRAGAEVLYLEGEQSGSADAIYTHDPALVADVGALILNMGKALRRDEPEDLAARLTELDVPVVHRLEGEAIAEGGDLLWVDPRTLAVGLGFRTNAAGLDSLSAALEPRGVTLIPVPLPHHRGPEACLHLMSLISIVDDDLAVIFNPLLPEDFRARLEERGFRFVEVPEQEFESMGTNVLALSPRHCLMLDGNPATRGMLEQAGCRVETYEGREISLKAEGGPTCLTRPILRAATSRAG